MTNSKRIEYEEGKVSWDEKKTEFGRFMRKRRSYCIFMCTA